MARLEHSYQKIYIFNKFLIIIIIIIILIIIIIIIQLILGSKLLIYNRVPKAGSSTLLTIIRELHYKHKQFSYETSEIFDSFTLTIPEELSLIAGNQTRV